MRSRNRLASMVLVCLPAVGVAAIAPAAAAAWQSWPKLAERQASNAIEIKQVRRGKPLYLPIGPSYLGYDYPYYYRRGFYPTHIGPGYIYYGYPYYYRKRYSSRCGFAQGRCAAHGRFQRGLRVQRGGF